MGSRVQAFFEQDGSYLETHLQTESLPAGIGTFYIFKDESRRQQFLPNRFRRREILPRRRLAELRLEETRQALEPLMEVIAALGRLPDPAEFAGIEAVRDRFGSLKRAFAAIRRITGEETWEAISRRRRKDLLVYLALARFRQRPKISHLPLPLQRDLKAFFGVYVRACAEADALLFQVGEGAALMGPASAGRGLRMSQLFLAGNVATEIIFCFLDEYIDKDEDEFQRLMFELEGR